MKPLVSIVITAKNAGQYVHACLESILHQTYQNWECIITDDHSDDDTSAIINRLALKDGRFICLSNDGNGIIDGLRCSYRHSRGQLITRMDADDIMVPTKLELMVSALTEVGEGHLAVGEVAYFSEDGVGGGYKKYAFWLNSLTRSAANFSEIYKECVIPSPCWMVYRHDFKRSGGFNSDVYPEDYDLCFRYRQSGLKIKPIPKVIHRWRDHETRASRNDPHYKDNRFLQLKCDWFLKEDYNRNKNLVLYGAGKKGKWIAKFLVSKKIPFTWITNNEKKIGRDIYGVCLTSETAIDSLRNVQMIIAVAKPTEQEEIVRDLETLGHLKGIDYFLFC